MSKRHNSNDKRPRPHGIAPREHFTRKNGSWKPKHAFENEAEADNFIEHRRYFRENGYKAYICPLCGQWHIGHSEEQTHAV